MHTVAAEGVPARVRSRRRSLDALRAFAIAAVVLIHAFQSTYAEAGAAAAGSWPCALAVFVGRLGVPLFFFLSGTLLLGKRFETAGDVTAFYRRNLLPLLVTVEVWCVLYTLWLWACGQEPLDVGALVLKLLFLKDLPLTHWWYMPMILGIYLVVPFVSMVVRNMPFKAVLPVLALGCLSCVGIPLWDGLCARLGLQGLELAEGLQLDLSFYGGLYGIYLVLGYYLDRRGLLVRVSPRLLLIVLLVSAAVGVVQVYTRGDLWYNSLWVLIAATCLFELVRHKDDPALVAPPEEPAGVGVPNPAQCCIAWVSKMSFGIYLCHMLFMPAMLTLTAAVSPVSLRSLACALALFAVALVFVFVSLVQPIPGLRRVLFDMR